MFDPTLYTTNVMHMHNQTITTYSTQIHALPRGTDAEQVVHALKDRPPANGEMFQVYSWHRFPADNSHYFLDRPYEQQTYIAPRSYETVLVSLVGSSGNTRLEVEVFGITSDTDLERTLRTAVEQAVDSVYITGHEELCKQMMQPQR